MGYTVLTKAHHSHSTDRLRRRLPPQPVWTPVGKNAEAIAMGESQQNDCPYPLQAMLVRYHLPAKIRYTSLLYYGETPPPALSDWFKWYNARQTLEAGIKQEKEVFYYSSMENLHIKGYRLVQIIEVKNRLVYYFQKK